MENKHSYSDLAQMQSLSLESKIRMSLYRIQQWYEAFEGNVYISFSGGKDSTVLLDLVRSLYPEVPAVFSDTGLEYPEIRDFVRTFDNVTIIRPEMNFRKIILEKGYPVISKEVARAVKYARKGDTKSGIYYRSKFEGTLLFEGKPSRYNMTKWRFLLEAPFLITHECCDIMKKRPFHKYDKETGRKPYIGTMADESIIRRQAWFRTGCNAFDSDKPKSAPLSFWTENDILTYIRTKNLRYCSVYGDIVETGKRIDCFGDQIPELKTTACDRTGCMFCMFGCHLEKEPNRFQRMKETYPKQYDYCMRPVSEGGLGMAEVLDYIGVPYRGGIQ